ncbi:hypothetical protein NL676_022476 [Syzygium grande]|nr:hypothetical protein NL676_022476 [Syzygium grande]
MAETATAAERTRRRRRPGLARAFRAREVQSKSTLRRPGRRRDGENNIVSRRRLDGGIMSATARATARLRRLGGTRRR